MLPDRPTRELDLRRRALFTALTVLEFRYAPGPAPPLLPALRAWLGSWPDVGRLVAGPTAQGLDPQLTRYGADGWQATVFPAGIAHSMTAAVGSAWAPEPWVAVQRAAWEGLRRARGGDGLIAGVNRPLRGIGLQRRQPPRNDWASAGHVVCWTVGEGSTGQEIGNR